MPYSAPMLVDLSGDSPDQAFIHYGHSGDLEKLSPMQYGWHRTPTGYGYGPAVRDHYLIHFVVSGKGKVVVHNHQYNVGAGQCFALFPHQITYYEADADDPWQYFWLGFEGEWCPELMGDAGFSDACIAANIPHAQEVFAVLEHLAEHIRDKEFFLLLRGHLHTIFYYLKHRDRAVEPVLYEAVGDQEGNPYVRILLAIIHTSFSERLSVQELANRLGLNRCYMTELFRKHTGQSIKAYLHEYRLQWSLIRLQSPSLPVKTVAFECGFDDPLYFSRAFRARFGVSPQQYRQREGVKALDK